MKKYNFYYGIPHAHTEFSTGSGTPKEAFRYAGRKKLNFLALTDHNKYLKANMLFKNKERIKWDVIKAEAERSNKKHRSFLALRGFEVYTSLCGHINVLNSEKLLEGKIKSQGQLLQWLEDNPLSIITINHPGSYIEKFKFIKELDRFINLIEVGNGSMPFKYIRRDQCYYKLLDYGWHLGAVNGQDNHRENWGDSENLTVILAESLKKEALMDALRSRRTYSTETRTLRLMVKAGETLMGGFAELENNETLEISVQAEDKKVPISKVQLISKGGEIIDEREAGNESQIDCSFKVTGCGEERWYVVKVIHSDGRFGIASPIFLKKLKEVTPLCTMTNKG